MEQSTHYINVVSRNLGWECPKCGRCNSPLLNTCPCWQEGQWKEEIPSITVPSPHDGMSYATTTSPDIGYTSPVVT